jgi:hypothetical protein
VLRHKPLLAAIAFCLVVRLVLILGFHVAYLAPQDWWQLLDPAVLQADPLGSLYLLHMQPPLFNALEALVLALPPTVSLIWLQGLYLGCSIAMMVLVHGFLRRFGYRPVTAAILTALFGVLPQVLVYENLFFYSHLEATLVLAASWCAARYFDERRLRAFLGFAACLVMLALLRSLFHLAWVAVALLAVWLVASRGRDRRALGIAVAAIAVVSVVYLKNFAEFGFFGASSWQGLASARMTLPINAGDADRFPAIARDFDARVARGEFSPATAYAGLNGDSGWTEWIAFAHDCDGPEKRPALCAIRKSNGELNLNHIEMVAYSRALGGDMLKGLRLYPALFIQHAGSSLITFFGTPSWSETPTNPTLQSYASLWERLLLYRSNLVLVPDRPGESLAERALSRFTAASLPLAVVVLAALLAIFHRALFDRDWLFPALVALLFIVVPNVMNGTEANRIRYTIEPLLFLALARTVTRA